MRVLVLEDDVRLAGALVRALRPVGVVADVASKGDDAYWMAHAAPYDVIVLDVMLPDLDGFETCRRLRDDGVWTPVIMVTARVSVEDRVRGLEAFLRNPGHVLTTTQLLEAAWDLGYEHRSNVVAVYVRCLREKIDRPFGGQSLETVKGVGYRLRADGGVAAGAR